jgi:hypothetical protein
MRKGKTMIEQYRTQNASYQLLYHRKQTWRGPKYQTIEQNVVEVALSAWSSTLYADDVLLMTSKAMVGMETVVYSRKVLEMSVAEAIEAAVKQFAELYQAYPCAEMGDDNA